MRASDQNVGPAVVVVVCDCSAHRPARIANAGAVRNVSKGSIVIVAIERTAGFFALKSHLDRGRVGEIDVQPAIAIVIQQKNTTAH